MLNDAARPGGAGSGFLKGKQNNTIATWKDFILAILISLLKWLFFCRMTFLDSYISSCPHNSLIHGFEEKGEKCIVELQTQELGSYSMFLRKRCTLTNILQREICSLGMNDCQWAVGGCHVTDACFKKYYAFVLRKEKTALWSPEIEHLAGSSAPIYLFFLKKEIQWDLAFVEVSPTGSESLHNR